MRRYTPPKEETNSLAQGMVEATTEYDYAEVPPHIQAAIWLAAYELQMWIINQEPIQGEVVENAVESGAEMRRAGVSVMYSVLDEGGQ